MSLPVQPVSSRILRFHFAALGAWGVLALAVSLTLAIPASRAGAAKARRLPDTSTKASIFASALPSGLTDAQLRFVAGHMAGAERVAPIHIAILRQFNPDFINLHQRMAVIAGPRPYFMGYAWASDWEWVSQHPDWFVRTHDGSPVRHLVEGGYLMDPSGELGGAVTDGWKEYWVDSSMDQMRNMGADGIVAKGYSTAAISAPLLDAPDPRFDEARIGDTWLPHLDRFGRYVKNRFATAPEDFLFVVEAGSLDRSWDNPDLTVADGIMVSNFARPDRANGPGRGESWKRQMNRLLVLQQMEKAVFCRSYLADPSDANDRLFRFCSYLLIKSSHAFFYLQHERGVSLEYYPEYEVNLGRHFTAPSIDVESFFRPEWGLYAREYQNGLVLVNPTNRSTLVKLDHPYLRLIPTGAGEVDESGSTGGMLGYQSTQWVILGPASAAILLSTATLLPKLPLLEAGPGAAGRANTNEAAP